MAKEKIKIVNSKKRKINSPSINPYDYGMGSKSKCPPGYHWMPAVGGNNGYCMEGEYHGASINKKSRRSISIEDHTDINKTKMLLNGTQLPPKHHSEVIDLMNWYKSGGTSYRWEPPKSCSGCGGGVGKHGCAGICVNGTVKKDKWKFTISWTF